MSSSKRARVQDTPSGESSSPSIEISSAAPPPPLQPYPIRESPSLVDRNGENPLYAELKKSSPFFVFAGPCVVESEEHAFEMAQRVKEIGANLGITIVYKSSFDKANRTSIKSFRGPGLNGLSVLQKVKERFHIPIITDIHEAEQAEKAAEVVDVLQIPAFLCRQTDLLVSAAKTGKCINIKKMQCVGPEAMLHAAQKVIDSGNPNVCLCDRGTAFGYNDLIVDYRNLVRMRAAGVPVVQDVTHAVQQPGGLGNATGGNREFIPTIARAAVATGVDGLFFEVHDNPPKALSDGPNSWPIQHFEELLFELVAIAKATKGKKNPVPIV